jgi:hypothetical protein
MVAMPEAHTCLSHAVEGLPDKFHCERCGADVTEDVYQARIREAVAKHAKYSRLLSALRAERLKKHND